MTGPEPEPGRQRERTAMAWRRTALALAGGCVLLVRAAANGGPVDTTWAGLGLACGLAALCCAELRYRMVLGAGRGLHRDRGAAPPVFLVAGMSAAMTAAGIAALVLLL